MIRSSQIEYQGISIIKKDYPILEKLASNYYSNLRLKDNLHVCLEYFGTKYKLDKHLEKEKELKDSFRKLIRMHDDRYRCVITVERSYVAVEKK